MEGGWIGCSTGGGEENKLGGSSYQPISNRLHGRPYVPGQDGGTPLDSDLDQEAGEEAHSPAGGARGVGGVVVGGVKLNQHQDYDFKHVCI